MFSSEKSFSKAGDARRRDGRAHQGRKPPAPNCVLTIRRTREWATAPLREPRRHAARSVPHCQVQRFVDLVRWLRARICQRRPAQSRRRPDHDGRRPRQAAAVLPLSCTVLAYHPATRIFPGEFCGYAAAGVVIIRIVSGFSIAGIVPDLAT